MLFKEPSKGLMWHYLTMGLRMVKIVVVTLSALAGVGPAAAVNSTSSLATGAVGTPTASQSPGVDGASDKQNRPNVGDEAPKSHEYGEKQNLLTDESGLIALGLATLIGAGTTVFVIRNRRKNSIY